MNLDDKVPDEPEKKDNDPSTCNRLKLEGGDKWYICRERELAPNCKNSRMSNNVYLCEDPSKESKHPGCVFHSCQHVV